MIKAASLVGYCKVNKLPVLPFKTALDVPAKLPMTTLYVSMFNVAELLIMTCALASNALLAAIVTVPLLIV